jgi:hypothetical protein
MKYRLLTICVLGLSAVAAGQSPTEISGTWAFTIQVPNEASHPTFVFKQTGEKLSGSYTGPLRPGTVNGTVKGNSAVFSIVGKTEQGEPATANYTATIVSPNKNYTATIVSPNKMTGTVGFHKKSVKVEPDKVKDDAPGLIRREKTTPTV